MGGGGQLIRTVAVAGGALVVLADLLDVTRALVVPRPFVRGPVAALVRPLRAGYVALGRALGHRARADGVLAAGEPVLLLVRLALWLALGVVGFALVVWGTGHGGFGQALVQSGSSVFTLGFATRPGTVPAVVAFLAAAFGLVVVALQIAYLPALYDAFNRRETLVTMLESRAGVPAWGPELLARHHLVGIQQNLPVLYGAWERWAADVAESHTTYPALLRLRSPHRGNNWLVALVAVLDAGALQLALNPTTAPAEARLCVRMGFTCLRDIARVLDVPFDPDPRPDQPIRLPFADFAAAVARMDAAGVPRERDPEEAWPHFRGWRVNYEPVADALATMLVVPPAPWLGRAAERAPLPARPRDRTPDRPGAGGDGGGRPSDRERADGQVRGADRR